jgi:hypothetical protein
VLARIGYGISPSTIPKNSIAPALSSETPVIMPTSVTPPAAGSVASSAGASTLGGTAGPEHLPSSGNVVAVSGSCGSGGFHRVETLVGITLVLIVLLAV